MARRIIDSRLCPIFYIIVYLKQTKLLRQSDQFFVQCATPYKDIPRDTIRRWTKQVLKLSGVDTVRFKAHSTRATATSLADSRHFPIDTILKLVGWKSSSTFARYYKRPYMVDVKSRFCHAAVSLSKAIETSTRLDFSSSDMTFKIWFWPSHSGMGEMEFNNQTNLPEMFDWDSIDSMKEWEEQTPSPTFRTSVVLIPTSCLSLPWCLVCLCDIHVEV